MNDVRLVKKFFLEGRSGKIEAIFNPYSGKDLPSLLAVCCHPHPLYEGTMHNKVVVTTAKTLSALGGAVIRFNFRGVMQSEGSYDSGKGEEEDVRSALDFLISEHHEAFLNKIPIVVAGFSFGAYVGMKFGSRDDRVSHLINIAAPTRMLDSVLIKGIKKPKLFIYGNKDSLNPFEEVQKLFLKTENPKQCVTVHDADHYFTSKQHIISKKIKDWGKSNLVKF